MWVRSDVTSGRNRRWEWRPDAGDAEDGKTTSDASGRGALASDAGLIIADVFTTFRISLPVPVFVHIALVDMIRLRQIIHKVVFLAHRFQGAQWC